MTRIPFFLIVLLVLSPTNELGASRGQAASLNFNPGSQDSTKVATDTPRKTKSPRGAIMRSLFFPGWGQFYNEQYLKSVIVFSGVTFFVVQAVRFNRKAADAPAGSAQRASYIDKRNLQFWFIGATTLLSMVDAYVDALLYDFDAGPQLQLRTGTLPKTPGRTHVSNSIGVTLRVVF